ncbi:MULTISPECIES: hypothetical protein [Sulfitobacter]|uniref:hypothetical protein n=1 Tax=Sulfitobacter TaxID=60136 RepID=UPI0007C265D2|nr:MULTISPECIES: hypothetical protein [Sulfitobacter]KZY51183.1 hypothetical protein A3734_00365 [Sulfitobacter sp. HI0054]MBO9440281.1 hypothetical protein [Sulfitobacter sp. R18_2]MDH4539994.1 hypothetical protein [Sulfitobacter faviae]TKA84110.1 hypothetical protein FCK22_17665 [Sulfitobacter sp. 15WGC]
MDGLHMPANDRGHSASVNRTAHRIDSVSRSLGYCLLLDNLDAWLSLPAILRARLSTTERAALAYVSLKALLPQDAEAVAEAALGGVMPSAAGQPIAPLFNHMDEAAFWADMAVPDEREAYCLASFKAMPYERQAAFLDFVQGRQAA